MCLPPTCFPALLLIYVSESVGGCRRCSACIPVLDIKCSTVPGRPSLLPASCTVAFFFFSVMFLSPGHRFTSAKKLFPFATEPCRDCRCAHLLRELPPSPFFSCSFCSQGSPQLDCRRCISQRALALFTYCIASSLNTSAVTSPAASSSHLP